MSSEENEEKLSETSGAEEPQKSAETSQSGNRSWKSRLGIQANAPEPRRRAFFLGFWGAVALAALFLFRSVLLPFFLAVVVAYVLAPVVRWLERRKVGAKNIPRWVSVVLVYLALLGVSGVLLGFGAPRMVVEVQRLAREVPEAVSHIRDEWVPTIQRTMRQAVREATPMEVEPDESSESNPSSGADGSEGQVDREPAPETTAALRIIPTEDGAFEVHLPEQGIVVEPRGERYRIVESRPRGEEGGDLAEVVVRAVEHATEDTSQTASTLLRTARKVIEALVKGVFNFFLMLMISAYLLITSDRILGFFRALWPQRRRRSFDRLILRIDKGLSGVVRGQILISLVNGVLSGIGFYALELRYWPVLTLIATLLSVIPIFGSILSTIPAVIIGLQQSPSVAAFVLIWIIVIHQIEANFLNPKIMGDAAKVHPVMVVFALLAGEAVFGLVGALLAVPVLSITQSLFNHYREVYLGAEQNTANG